MCEPFGPNQRADSNGGHFLDYQVAPGEWVNDRGVCHHCLEQKTLAEKFYHCNDVRTSFGYYAGRYCDDCWKTSGYRDADDDTAVFSELDAGESLHGEDDGGHTTTLEDYLY